MGNRIVKLFSALHCSDKDCSTRKLLRSMARSFLCIFILCSAFAPGLIQAEPVLGPDPPHLPCYSTSFSPGSQVSPANLYHPFGIVVDSSGNLYVADRLYNRILMRDPSDNWTVLSSGTGTAPGQFTSSGVTGGPAGLALDSAGALYVADWGSHRIQVRDVNGTWSAWGAQPWGTAGSSLGQFNSPTGVAVDNEGNVYVADTLNNRIQKRDTNGNWTQWSNYNWLPGGFMGPKGVAVDGDGNIYVADQSNQRIHMRLVSDGTWTYISSTTTGTAAGQFSSPTQVVADSAGNIYVSDTYNYRVQRRDVDGNWSFWGSAGANSGQFDTPEGVAVDSSGNIYVADTMNNRVQMFTQNTESLYKIVDNNAVLAFSEAEFSGHFTPTPPDAVTYSLVTVRIDTLPLHGTLRLGTGAVSAGQELAAASLGTLTYTPDTTYGGTDHFLWNAADQVGYAPNQGSVGITVRNVSDIRPDSFTFAAQTGLAPGTVATSDSITVSGINAAAPISVSNGSYSINNGGFTQNSGEVNNGDGVRVRQTASSGFSTTTTAVLNIGGVTADFSVTTQAADTTPDAFSFTSQTGAALSAVAASNAITVSGINTGSPVSIANGEYSLNGGAYTAQAGTVNNGDSVTVRQTSSSAYGTTTVATLTIGGVNGTFSVTTQQATTTVISAPSVTYASNGTVTVTVSSAAGAPTGNVSLTVDGGAPATQALAAGSAIFTITSPGAGNHTLSASYAAQGDFGASSASGSLAVNPAATTTSINAPGVTYGQDSVVTVTVNSGALAATGSVSLTVDGGSPVTQALAAGVAVFTLTAPASGSHAVLASYAAQGNFLGSSAEGTFSVGQGATTILISAPAATYGANGTVTVSVSSTAGTPAGNVSLTVDNGAPTTQALAAGSTTFTVTSPGGGSHALSASYAAQGDFLGSSASGELLVNKVTLTITANDATRAYQAEDPAFTATYAGFVNGDTATNLSGALTFATSASADSLPGAYTITPSGQTSTNYDITYVNGVLTVTAGLSSVSTAQVSNITLISATGGGLVLSDGGSAVTARGVCWGASPNPTLSDSCSGDGAGLGAFSSSMNGMNPGTQYHVRAYAMTANGTSYGEDVSYSTLLAGDLTGEGAVDAADALRSLKIAAEIETPTSADLAYGDVGPLVNGMPQPDGTIDLNDVVVILRIAAGYVLW